MNRPVDPEQEQEPGRTGDKAETGEPTARFPEEEGRQPSHADGDPETVDAAEAKQAE